MGGIGQGITVEVAPDVKVTEIDAMGGWLGMTFSPVEKWCFGGGYAVDTADVDDLADDGTAREYNSTAFVNAIYKPFKATAVGVEAAYHDTQWHENDDGHALCLSMFMQLNF